MWRTKFIKYIFDDFVEPKFWTNVHDFKADQKYNECLLNLSFEQNFLTRGGSMYKGYWHQSVWYNGSPGREYATHIKQGKVIENR